MNRRIWSHTRTSLPILFFLCILMILNMVRAVDLPDIEGHWAQNDIRDLTDMGAITGYPDGTYRPNHTITRAEFASVLRGTLGLEEAPGSTFIDTADHWAQARIEALVKNGVIDIDLYGTHYHPNEPITREEIVMMTVRMVGETADSTDVPFIDADQIGQGYSTYVAQAYAYGITQGYPDDTFRPKGTATRAEAAVMTMRAYRILAAPDTAPVITSFVSADELILSGSTTSLSWQVEGADTVTIDQEIGHVEHDGSIAISPSSTITYTLTAINQAGSRTKAVTVEVSSIFFIPPIEDEFMILSPKIDFLTIDKSVMTQGLHAYISWQVSGIASVSIEPDIGKVAKTGMMMVSPPVGITTYTLTATNISGSTNKSLSIEVKPKNIIQPGPTIAHDTQIASQSKHSNYGGADVMSVGISDSPQAQIHSFLRFDAVNNIPSNTVIESAKLALYLYEVPIDSTGFTVNSHAVFNHWEEYTLTWDNQPGFDGEPLSTQSILSVLAPYRLYWDITPLVQSWVNGEKNNHGIALTASTETVGLARFRTADYALDLSLHPKLIISSYIPSDNIE